MAGKSWQPSHEPPGSKEDKQQQQQLTTTLLSKRDNDWRITGTCHTVKNSEMGREEGDFMKTFMKCKHSQQVLTLPTTQRPSVEEHMESWHTGALCC